jgi:RimJ/RimL family protein N-acetyltransferase
MGEQPVLETERLLLRPFAPADAPTVERLAGDRLVADTTLAIPHPYPAGAAAEWFATHHPNWDEGKAAQCAITDRTTGDVLGAIGLVINRPHDHAEMGYWVGVPYWNRGYCTEAAGALLTLAFGELGLHRVFAHHLVRNPASGRVMQKLGMRFEGINRHAIKKWDVFEDIACYGILADEWPPPDA